MRQADINRVNKAREHLKEARTLLSGIDLVDAIDALIIINTKEVILNADMILDELINLKDNEQ